MQNFFTHNDSTLSVFREKLQNFIYSKLFPVFLSIVTLVFWIADLQVAGLIIVSLSGVIVLIFFDDVTPVYPVLFLQSMVYRDAKDPSVTIFSIIFLGLLGAALIFNLIKYPIKKIKIDVYLVGLFVLTGAFLIGGIFSPYLNEFSSGLPIFAISCVAPIAIHIFATSKNLPPKNVNAKNYFIFSFLCAINVACLQMLYAFFCRTFINWRLFEIPGGFAWANTNHIANLILIAVPLCYYLIARADNIFEFLPQLVFLYGCCFVSQGHGGIAVLGLGTPLMLYFTYVNMLPKNRKKFCACFIVAIVLILLFALYFYIFENEQAMLFLEKMLDNNSRSPLYEKGWNIFLEFPIFGTGLGHAFIQAGKIYNGYFHSTFFHALVAGGAIAILAYVFLYYTRLKALSKNDSLLGKFMIIATGLFLCYGIVENSEFNIVLIYYTAVLSFTTTVKKEAEEDIPLPLYKKFSNLS